MKKILLFFILMVFCCGYAYALPNYASLSSGITPISVHKKCKNISKNFIAQNKLKKVSQGLSDVDKSVIDKYVNGAVRGENTFLYMNAYLLGNLEKYIPEKEIIKPLQSRLQYYADNLAESVLHAKLPQNTILYTGIDERHAAKIFSVEVMEILKKPVSEENLTILKTKLSGKTFTDKSFLKATYDLAYVSQTKYILEINAPKNLRAVSMDGITTKAPKQVVVDCGYKWKISGITREFDRNKDFNYYKISLKLCL